MAFGRINFLQRPFHFSLLTHIGEPKCKIQQQHQRTNLVSCHTILNKKSDAGVEVSDVTLKYEVFLGLGGYLPFEVAKTFLCCLGSLRNADL
jgi:hypothetical protein